MLRAGMGSRPMAGDSIRICPAEPADADAIARVQGETWRAAYLGMLPHEILAAFGQAQGGAFWERVLTKAPAELVLVAELGDQILGFIPACPIREADPRLQRRVLCALRPARGTGLRHRHGAARARRPLPGAATPARCRGLGAGGQPSRPPLLRAPRWPRARHRQGARLSRHPDYPAIREMAYGWPDLRRATWLVDEPNRR